MKQEIHQAKAHSLLARISITFLFAQTSATFIVTPALAYIAEAYPNVPFTTITLLTTLVGLVGVPFSVLSGLVAGKKVKYKTLAVISLLLISLGGAVPYFTRGFGILMASRVIIGIGLGLMLPMGNTIVLQLFKGKEAASMQGAGNMVANALSILIQFVSTSLVLVGVAYIWLLHLLFLIPAALVFFFLPEPEKPTEPELANASKEEKTKEKFTLSFYLVSAAFGTMFMVFYPVLLNSSAIVLKEGLGLPAIVAVIGSMYKVGGMIAGAIYARVYSSTGRYFFPVALATWVLGVAIVAFGPSALLLAAGTAIAGIGYYMCWPGTVAFFSKTMSSNAFATATGLFSAFLSACSFGSTPYTMLVASVSGSDSPRLPLQVSMMIMAGIAVVWSIAMLRNESEVAAKVES